jgi:hypothetical protein
VLDDGQNPVIFIDMDHRWSHLQQINANLLTETSVHTEIAPTRGLFKSQLCHTNQRDLRLPINQSIHVITYKLGYLIK